MELKKLKISDKKIAVLSAMKIMSVEDLITYYPFRYEENTISRFDAWEKGQKVCFEGEIISRAVVTRYGYKKSITRFTVAYDDTLLKITLFNRPWVASFTLNKIISIFGKYEGNNNVTCMNYNAQPLCEQLGLQPVYNVKDGIHQKDIISYINKALKIANCEAFVPEELCKRYQLMDRDKAFREIHKPSTKEGLKQSLRALKYEEFLKFQIQMQYMKSLNTQKKGLHKYFDTEKIHQFMANLPFTLTKGQAKAIDDLLIDLKSDRIMYRLIQGDVGCGKTMVALIGMYACVLANQQAAMMAPTEILAKQHYQNIKKMFKDVPLTIAVLYSSLPKKEKDTILENLANGTIDIVIGTHSLFQEDVNYANLGMVVADEQHRFGVEQRRKLIEKGDKVDFLLMSATPIPRTLAVSLFGDMDVSTIEELPKGRKEIQTVYIEEDSLRSVLHEIMIKLDEQDQCYIVCPAIEKNEEYGIRNVEDLYENMTEVLGKKYRIAYLHGKLSSEEKENIMDDFLAKKYQILITTTVIEVGVDVKDANIIVLYDAHRFGMSQIHQLRGRVGRGDRQGYCYLLSGTNDADSKKRLQLCASISDGFEIAKQDLLIRGAGDLLGVRQSGISGFILGDIVMDFAILETARKDALYILEHLANFKEVQAFINEKDYTSYLD